MDRNKAINLLEIQSNKSDFVQSLCNQFFNSGKLSEKQWYWVEKIATEILEEQESEKPEPVVVADIQGVLLTASHYLKYPKVWLGTKSGKSFRLSLASGQSKYSSQVMIKESGDYESTYYGRIDLDGNLVPSRYMTEEMIEALVSFNKNPVETATEFGKKTGNCCFCHKPLTDEKSTTVGYGATCAKHYGLPWGKKTADAIDHSKVVMSAKQMEELGFEYVTCEYDAQYQCHTVYGWGHYEDNSVLAGQVKKQYLNSFDTPEDAFEAYPCIESFHNHKISAGNTFDHLPDDGDDGWDQRDCVHFDMGR